jgi:diguanylate cyclase (GGDEF)-like protein
MKDATSQARADNMQQDNTDKIIVDTEEITPDYHESRDPFQLVQDNDFDTTDLPGQSDTLASDEFSIDELRTTAEQFNTAFSIALHELENTRCQLADRSARIDDLNDAIRETGAALQAQVESGRHQQEIHTAETERLNARIRELEEQHCAALQQMESQRNDLDTRTSEASKLKSQVEELTRTLDAQWESFRQQQEDHAGELATLNHCIQQLDEQRSTALQQIEAQHEELETRARKAAELDTQVEKLTCSLNKLSESKRHLEEMQARECDEHDSKITELATALQHARESCRELEEHSAGIEKLNKTLHEASLAEAQMYRQKLEIHTRETAELAGKIERLNGTRREREEKHTQDPADSQFIQSLQEQIDNLGSALQQSESRCGELETTLRHTNEKAVQNTADRQTQEYLQHRVEELTHELDRVVTQRDGLATGSSNVSKTETCSAELAAALNTSEQALRLVDEYATEPVTYIRGDTHIYANRRYLHILGDTASGDSPIPCLRDFIPQDVLDSYSELIASSARGPVEGTGFSLNLREENTDALGLHVMQVSFEGEPCTRVTIRLAEQRKVPQMTHAEPQQQDLLTGLYNRQYFIDTLKVQLMQESGGEIQQAVMYVLLDNFMKIRKDIGILNSELVLKDIGEILMTCLAETDVLARFGDYSFTILYSNCDNGDIAARAEQVRGLIETHIAEVGGRTTITTASIGICMLNNYTHTVDDILARADLACEMARTSGGNRVHIHSTVIDEQTDDGNADNWDKVIGKILEEERFYIVHQPIISLSDKPGSRYEVLLRILDENGNSILPGQFFSMAGKTGLAAEIDRIVIENVFRAAADGRNTGATLFIKLCQDSVADADLAMWILKKLDEFRLAGERVVFEIPEQVMARELKNAAMLTRALHSMHCKVAIEHYACTTQPQHLKHVHADILKIDGHLIATLDEDRENRNRISAIVSLARQNHMETIAERVEDAASLALLWDLGVDYALGNFIQEPCRNMNYDFCGEIVSEEIPDDRAIFMTTDQDSKA